MRSAAFAEWLLRRVTTKESAAAIVGDLLESRDKTGAVRFWLSIAGIALLSSWRWMLAPVLAFCAGMWALGALQIAVFGIKSPHPAPTGWQDSFEIVTGVGTILWFLAPYLLVRYGFRDRVAQFATGAATTCAVLAFFWWKPWVVAICAIVGVAGTAVCLFDKERRKAAFATGLAAVVGFTAAMGMFYLDFLYTRLLLPGMLIGDAEMAAHPSLRWVPNSLLIAGVLVTLSMCSWFHNLFARRDSDSKEVAISDQTFD